MRVNDGGAGPDAHDGWTPQLNTVTMRHRLTFDNLSLVAFFLRLSHNSTTGDGI